MTYFAVDNAGNQETARTITSDSVSIVVNGIKTSVLFQPAAFRAGLGGPNVAVGGVLSMPRRQEHPESCHVDH